MPLPPAISNQARQVIRSAFEDLEHIITPSDSRDFSVTSLQNVRKAALDIEDQLAARQALRNMRRLMPLFEGLEHYSKVVDVLCNGTPYLAWVWSPITLILRIASEYVEAFEQIIKGYSRIAESLSRFEVIQNAFVGNKDFQCTLAAFYADILLFHKHAYVFVRRSGWRLLFLTSWGRFQRRFDNILEDMKRHESLIDKGANALNIAEARQMREDIQVWREESLGDIVRAQEQQATRQYQSIVSWLKADETDQMIICESVTSEGMNHPGTCSWALKNAKVASWMQRKTENPTLLLVGNPGTGKSVLATQLLNFMKAAEMLVVHHFCHPSYASSLSYEQILRSILLQVLRKDEELVAHIYNELVAGKKPPVVPLLEKLVRTILTSLSHEPRQQDYIWIIIDGFDSCEAEKQASLISLLNQVTSGSSSGVVCKVLVTSRASPMLTSRLRRKHTVSLTEEKNSLEAAIKLYASQRLQGLHETLCELRLKPSDIGEIEDRITQKADGMFLYARLVLDYIKYNIFYTREEIKDSINELPRTLSDFYRRILMQMLVRLDSRSADRVRCVFGWIAFAKRPLKKIELLSAITFSSGNPMVASLVPQYILDICSALVEERRGSTLGFIHTSVKEFLLLPSSPLSIMETQAQQEQGTALVTCLLSNFEKSDATFPEQNRCIEIIQGLHAILLYAAEHWIDYVLLEAKFCLHDIKDSKLLILASQLADGIELRSNPDSNKVLPLCNEIYDERIVLLERLPILSKHVQKALADKSLSNLESSITMEGDSNKRLNQTRRSSNSSSISEILESYQEKVRFLLGQETYPGVTSQDFDSFKQQFRASGYTCKLKSCPRATLGFDSREQLLEHEIGHVRLFCCEFTECRYPPFPSARSLKTHENKHHRPSTRQRSIRRVGKISDHPKEPFTQMRTHVENFGDLISPNLPESTPSIGFTRDRSEPAPFRLPSPPHFEPIRTPYNGASSLLKTPSPLPSLPEDYMPVLEPELDLQENISSPFQPVFPRDETVTPDFQGLTKIQPELEAEWNSFLMVNEEDPLLLGARTNQQVVNLDAEDQKRYEQIIHVQPSQITPQKLQDMQKLRTIAREEAKRPCEADVLMDQETKATAEAKLRAIVKPLTNVHTAVQKWFQITHDETRARAFFRTKYRISAQFKNNEMTQLNEALSMKINEIDTARMMLATMVKDLADNFPLMVKPKTPQSQAAPQPQTRGTKLPSSEVPGQSFGFEYREKDDRDPSPLRYKRPVHHRVFCKQCNNHPEGFRGEHELRRHQDRQHKKVEKKWICVDPTGDGLHDPKPAVSLSECRACVQEKMYGAYYNAAAHLRRHHFKPKISKGRSKGTEEADGETRSGKTGGDWPPMSELKRWMKEIVIAVV